MIDVIMHYILFLLIISLIGVESSQCYYIHTNAYGCFDKNHISRNKKQRSIAVHFSTPGGHGGPGCGALDNDRQQRASFSLRSSYDVEHINRREILTRALIIGSTSILPPYPSFAEIVDHDRPDVAKISTTKNSIDSTREAIRKISPNNTISNTKDKIQIPKIGYSLYKTDADQVQRGINLALHAGIRHFDVASLYATNNIVGDTLHDYCKNGLPNIDEKGFMIESDTKNKNQSSSLNFQKRRKELFISHKIQNDEQNADKQIVKDNVQKEMMNILKVAYLDMVMIHSPLTDKERRINTYKALVELKNEGTVKAIGVCHYSCSALDEIIDAGLPPPDMIQLQLSPFNQHKDIISWSQKYKSLISCSAWSRLSSIDGPQEGWAEVSRIAQSKNMTKAQVLVQWAIQKSYCCVPRSGVKSKIERVAIYENSYRGMTDGTKWKEYYLNQDEMNILNGLDERLKIGKLGVVDGWKPEDIVDANWDPTDLVVSS